MAETLQGGGGTIFFSPWRGHAALRQNVLELEAKKFETSVFQGAVFLCSSLVFGLQLSTLNSQLSKIQIRNECSAPKNENRTSVSLSNQGLPSSSLTSIAMSNA